jgi:hypothetical protein
MMAQIEKFHCQEMNSGRSARSLMPELYDLDIASEWTVFMSTVRSSLLFSQMQVALDCIGAQSKVV